MRDNSPSSQTAGGDTSDPSDECVCIPSGHVFPRESFVLFSRHLGMAADETKTVLKEIEDCRSERQEPEIEGFHTVIKKLAYELKFQSECCGSFAKFYTYGPEHMLEAKKMMADRNYVWACAGKQLEAFDSDDPVRAEYWRLCFVAFCYLWGDRKPSNIMEEHIINAARTYAVEAREFTDEEREQLKNTTKLPDGRFKTNNDELVDSKPDKEGH